jgi:hypothetical protein
MIFMLAVVFYAGPHLPDDQPVFSGNLLEGD